MHENTICRTDRSFIGELRVRFPEGNKWQTLNGSIKTFLDRLPVVAILNRKIICVNGMVSSNIKNEKNVVTVKNGSAFENHNTRLEVQFVEIDTPGPITPNKIDEESKTMKELLKSLDMSMIINSNNVLKDGYKFSLGNQLLTIISGTKMVKAYNNTGVVMMVSDKTDQLINPLFLDGSSQQNGLQTDSRNGHRGQRGYCQCSFEMLTTVDE